ncbi:MAG: reverse transcriptase family protein [Bacteroidales bacterium]
MTSLQEILTIAKTNKSKITKYFYDGSYHLCNVLENFKKHELNALFLLTIDTPAELCRFLKTPFFQLEEVINNPTYKHYKIKKKKGGERQIFAPEDDLKAIQKRLNYFLQAYYLCVKPNEVHGFVVNPHYLGTYCNIVENAKVHINKNYVLNIDLKDFFPSITAKQVKNIFISQFFNYNEEIANALTLLTTFEGKLPIGAPSSPVISNFICHQLDKDLINFCKDNQLAFTRYADDLTFSSDTVISNDITLDIINVIKENNFEINQKKLRLKTSNCKQTVTGLTVNKKVNVDRKLLKKIRAMLHDLTTNGVQLAVQRHFLTANYEQRHGAVFIHRLEGYINFVGQVRGKTDPIYIKHKTAFDKVFEPRK